MGEWEEGNMVVPVEDVVAVHKAKGRGDFSRVEESTLNGKALLALEMEEEFS